MGKFDTRLDILRKRRTTDSLLYKQFDPDEYETKLVGRATKYALGCMEQVKPKYTQTSLEEGQRVAEQLVRGLPEVETRLQGSVPLNIHIYASSDVDLLLLTKRFVTVDAAVFPFYTPLPGINVINALSVLRGEAAVLLRQKYPAATVDNTGSKAIALSGGSLARKVDVVPSHWHDGADYHKYRSEAVRGVRILDKCVFRRT